MKKKRIISLMLIFVMVITMFAGCGKNNGTKKDGKISISMYLWDRFMLKEFSPWLEQKFPDIEFTFVQSYNSMDYYKDLLARGEDLKAKRDPYLIDDFSSQECMQEALEKTKQFLAPTEYVTILQGK